MPAASTTWCVTRAAPCLTTTLDDHAAVVAAVNSLALLGLPPIDSHRSD